MLLEKDTNTGYQLQVDRILKKRGIFDLSKFRDRGAGVATSVTSIERGTVINAPVLNNPRIEDAEFSGDITGLDEVFADDYIKLYSIETNRDYLDFHTREIDNGIKLSYRDKLDTYLTFDWNSVNDVFGNAWTKGYTNNFLKSEFSDVLFRPRSGMNTGSKFRIEDMGVEIENNLSVGSMDVNDVINTHNIKVNNQGSLMEIEGDILIKGVLTQENPPRGGCY